MKAAFAAVLSLLASALAHPARAADNNLIPHQLIVKQFADCVERSAKHGAIKMLRTTPGSKEEHDLITILAFGQSQCLTDRALLSMKPWNVRGAVAEAVFARHPEWLQVAAKLPVSAPARPPEKLEAEAFMIAYSRCIAASAPERTAAILQTKLASPEERQATLALGDALQACVPLDIAYHLNVVDLRVHLASALFLALPEAVTKG